MRNTGIHRRLLFEQHIYMVNSHVERQRESFDRERHALWVIVEPQEIELAHYSLDAPLQLTHTLLLTRKVLDNVLENGRADSHLLE